MNVQELYQKKLTTAAEAVKAVKSGDWVDYGWCTNHPWQKYQRIAAYPKTIYYTHLMQSRHRFPSLILYILTVVIHFM